MSLGIYIYVFVFYVFTFAFTCLCICIYVFMYLYLCSIFKKTHLQVEHNYDDSSRCHLIDVDSLAFNLGLLEKIGFVDGGGHKLAARAQYKVESDLSESQVLKRKVLKETWVSYDKTVEEIQTFLWKKQKQAQP